jgi:hypothetical protein
MRLCRLATESAVHRRSSRLSRPSRTWGLVVVDSNPAAPTISPTRNDPAKPARDRRGPSRAGPGPHFAVFVIASAR